MERIVFHSLEKAAHIHSNGYRSRFANGIRVAVPPMVPLTRNSVHTSHFSTF
jgi:hypothetical protein